LITYLLASAAITESVRVKAETLDMAQADYRYQVGAAVNCAGADDNRRLAAAPAVCSVGSPYLRYAHCGVCAPG